MSGGGRPGGNESDSEEAGEEDYGEEQGGDGRRRKGQRRRGVGTREGEKGAPGVGVGGTDGLSSGTRRADRQRACGGSGAQGESRRLRCGQDNASES